MATYIIGDIQGCFDDLLKLLNKIEFNTNKDKLIFCGDLVNRGGQSLDVLRWVYAHQNYCQVTLGNHDLSLLSQYFVPEFRKSKNREFKQIFQSSDCSVIMKWLLKQKLLIELKEFKILVAHAGIYPIWTKKRAKKEASRVESLLIKNPVEVFKKMYGVKPNHWHKSLSGIDRTRFAINSFTRMRYLYKNKGLNLKAKGAINSFPKLIPWFNCPREKKINSTIIFGHWSTLGLHSQNGVMCIDTGKVWGGQLTALKVDNLNKKEQHIFQV